MLPATRILRIAIENDRSYAVVVTVPHGDTEYRYIVQDINASGQVVRDVYDVTGGLKAMVELFDLRIV